MRTMGSALLKFIQQQNDAGLDYGRDWQGVSCPYCVDGGFLTVDPQWLIAGRIPPDVEAKDYYQAKRRIGVVQIGCDCHGGQMGPKDGQAPIKRFADWFGERIHTHWYGRRLMELRQHWNQLLQGQPDAHMHHSQAWEVLDGGQADPPPAPDMWADADELPPF